MIEQGFITEDERTELINGLLYTKMSIGSSHGGMVNRLMRLLTRLLGDSVIIAVQNPITINEYSEPEPDIVVAKFRDDYYGQSHPQPDDILLVIEVADTSLAFDRDTKVPLYAACGIKETWLLDLTSGTITSYRDPDGATYRQQQVFRNADTLSMAAFPDIAVSLSELGL